MVENFIIQFFANIVSRGEQKVRKEEDVVQEKVTNVTVAPTEQPVSTLQYDIGARLSSAIELLNFKRSWGLPKLNAVVIARDLKIDNIGDVEKMLQGETMLNSFVKVFAEEYHICENWLITGERTPFDNHCEYFHDAEDVIPIAQKYEPKEVAFFIEDSEERCVAILMKKNEYDFKVMHAHSNWRLSSHVGAGGAMQMVSLYKTFQYFERTAHGYQVTNEEFWNLLQGRVSANILEHRRYNHMWEDFLDIEHKYPIAKDYKLLYGEEFLNAQDIVRHRMKKTA